LRHDGGVGVGHVGHDDRYDGAADVVDAHGADGDVVDVEGDEDDDW